MTEFTLYSTSACHLCEVAESMLEAACADRDDVHWAKVDIADSDALFERYGVLIPVLAHPGGAELRWPFTAEELRDFLTI